MRNKIPIKNKKIMLTMFWVYDIIRMYQVNMKTCFIVYNIKLVIFKDI